MNKNVNGEVIEMTKEEEERYKAFLEKKKNESEMNEGWITEEEYSDIVGEEVPERSGDE